jgi:hypothetical protein
MTTTATITRQPAETWTAADGWVCAEVDPNGPNGMCGQPTADKPCPDHGTPNP